jgi:Zn-dependent peptidase ImmA (M78 family)
MASVKALITPQVISWARQQSGFELEVVAKRLSVDKDKIQSWESGVDLPTIPQARELSKIYKRPLAVFYMPEPPEGFQTLRDYRKLARTEERMFSPEMLELIRTVQDHQAWLKDYLRSEGVESLSFVGSVRLSAHVKVAELIRKELDYDIEQQINTSGRYEALRLFISKIEEAGIFIVRQGGIELSECRGFVVSNEVAPFIFLNLEDAKAAQLFTLAHELAHIWLGNSGISNLGYRGSFLSRSEDEVEQFCNRVASEIILPSSRFDIEFSNLDSGIEVDKRIEALSKIFKVSEEVIARRLLSLSVISEADYRRLRDYYNDRWLEHKKEEKRKQKEKDGGPSYYTKMITYNGLAFTQTVFGAYSGGKLSGRDASSLLNVKLNNFKKLSESTNKFMDSRFNLLTSHG